MKILVCTDGSGQSQKAIEAAAKIACGCDDHEVAVVHVYERSKEGPYRIEGNKSLSEDMNRQFRALEEQKKKDSQKILSAAAQHFSKQNVKVTMIGKEGNPAETIVNIVSDEGFDIVVLGRRGLGGFKKLFLGSVSNAVLNEAKANVLIVK